MRAGAIALGVGSDKIKVPGGSETHTPRARP